jgi:hypothetical protein
LEDILTAFFAEHGQTPASAGTIKRAGNLLSEEGDNVTLYKDSWHNKRFFTAAFRPLLLFVISCVQDIIKHKKLDVPIPIKLIPEDGSCRFRLQHREELCNLPFLSSLNGDVVDSILEQAGPVGECSPGNFRTRDLASERHTCPKKSSIYDMTGVATFFAHPWL